MLTGAGVLGVVATIPGALTAQKELPKRHGRPHAPALSIADCGIRIADRKQVSQIRILHSAIRNSDGPRSRRRSSKPNLQELGGKARGSTREIKTYRFAIKNFSCVSHGLKLLRGLPKFENGCVAQTELEQASHKREVGGSTPSTARSFSICHLRFITWSFSNPAQDRRTHSAQGTAE